MTDLPAAAETNSLPKPAQPDLFPTENLAESSAHNLGEINTGPSLAVAKFTSCDGCQLSLLNLEDHFLDLTSRFGIVEFPEASSLRHAGPYDVLLIEGSISTPEQTELIQELRKKAKILVTIGACATTGGVQALRNWANHDEFRASIYPHPEFISDLATSTAIEDHVTVDFALPGCPIHPDRLLELLSAFRAGRRPQFTDEAVCAECKRRGTVCVIVAQGIPCLGPVTRAGCHAICPSYERGCYGCFGPKENANIDGFFTYLRETQGEAAIAQLFPAFTACATPFRDMLSVQNGRPVSVRVTSPNSNLPTTPIPPDSPNPNSPSQV